MKDNISTPGFLFPLLAFICISIIFFGLNKVLQKTGWPKLIQQKIFFGAMIFVMIWTGLLTVLSLNGFFADFSKLPPRPVLALLFPLPFVVWIAFSKKGTALLQLVPPQWLVLIQSFRVVVELLIFLAFMAGKLPVQMTFEGRNFDLLTGLLALPVGYVLLKKKSYSSKLTIAFNVAGILLLLNILIVAVLSMPTSFRYFMNEPSSAAVAQFPFIFLPSMLVPIAYSFHLFSLRRLLIKK